MEEAIRRYVAEAFGKRWINPIIKNCERGREGGRKGGREGGREGRREGGRSDTYMKGGQKEG